MKKSKNNQKLPIVKGRSQRSNNNNKNGNGNGKRFVTIPILEKVLKNFSLNVGYNERPDSFKSRRSIQNSTVFQDSSITHGRLTNPKEDILSGRNLIGVLKTSPANGATFYVSLFTGLNPTNVGVFGNKLPIQAECFDRYRIISIHLVYEPSLPTTTVGNTYLGWQRNPDDLTPSTQQDFMNYDNSVGSACYMPLRLKLDTRQFEDRLFYVNPDSTETEDGRLSYFGNIMGATQGFATTFTNAPVGQLFIEYKIRLYYQANPGGIGKIISGTECPCCSSKIKYIPEFRSLFSQALLDKVGYDPLLKNTHAPLKMYLKDINVKRRKDDAEKAKAELEKKLLLDLKAKLKSDKETL